jgi:hypothetical protein
LIDFQFEEAEPDFKPSLNIPETHCGHQGTALLCSGANLIKLLFFVAEGLFTRLISSRDFTLSLVI